MTGSLGWTIGVTALVVAVCWIQPIWDQVAGSGNMGRVLDQGGGSDRSIGFTHGLRILAESGFLPPFFTPGSMGDLLRSGPGPSTLVSVVALGAWAGLLVAVFVVTRRSGTAITALAAIAITALAASVYAVAKIPPTEQFGIIAQNYYWAWPIGIFAAMPLVGWAVRRLLSVLPTPPGRWAQAVAWLALVPIALGAVPLLRPTDRLPETSHEWAVSLDQARPMMDEFGAALDGYDFTAPVLIDLGAVRHVRYTLLTELQRRGIDFRFAPGSTDLSRFGRERCDDGTATALITLRGGADALRLDLPGTLLAAVPGATDAQAERIDTLAAEVGDALRDGSIVVDDEGVRYLGGQIPVQLARVRTSSGLAARGGVAKFLLDYASFDAVEIADELVADVRELRDLEIAENDNRMVLHLQTISGVRPDHCDDIDPGDEFLGTT